jgi:phosphatidylglycerol:prolipoprotein diacylglycerol transferase
VLIGHGLRPVTARAAYRDFEVGQARPPLLYCEPTVLPLSLALWLFIPWFKLEAWQIPVPFTDLHLPIQPFGVLVATGIVVGSRVAEWRAEKTGVPRHVVNDFLVHTIVIGLFLCMVLNVLFYEPEKFAEMGAAISRLFRGEKMNFPYPGLSSFGGFFGGTAAAIWFRQKRRVSLMVLGDIFCFAFPFAWIFGRSGCFVVHDHPGLVTDFFLAVDNYRGEGVARHDLGFYEVLWSAAMIPTVLLLGRKPRPWGFFMAFVPIVYAPIRFGLDFLRESAENGGDVRYFGLTPGHYAAILLFLAGIGVAIRVARKPQQSLWLDGAPPPSELAREQAAAAPAAKKSSPPARRKQRAK